MKRKTPPIVIGTLILLILVIFASVQLWNTRLTTKNPQVGDLPTVGQVISGFVVEGVQDFPEAKGTLITFRHEVSGAQLCYIKNDDTNRAFSIGYRTPMADESDISHVFEHSILASSEKYPSHTLMYDLINKSYSTYANALTFQTFTFYPVASQSEEQLRNMADVVLSCMVAPGVLSDENFFKREALRYTLENVSDPITMNGTVFTEDLSSLTDTQENAWNNTVDTLYPGEYASNMIGRAWENYEDLTYDKAKQLYEQSYHFDNSILQLYGDLDYESFLTFLDSQYLSHYPDSHTDLSAYDQPAVQTGYKEVSCYSPAYEGDSTQDACVIHYAFDLDGQSYETLRRYEVLCDLLNANDSLFQANLHTAGLGNASVSLTEDSLKPLLSFELSNVNQEDAQTFRQVVEDTLASIRSDGFDRTLLERIFKVNRFSQYLSEESSSKAIEVYFANILLQWATTGNTDYFAQNQQALDDLNGSQGQELFKQLASGLLECSNTALVATIPQPGLAEQIQMEQETYLTEMKSSMTQEELDQLVQDTKSYDAWAEEDVTNNDFIISVNDLPDPDPQPGYERKTENGITYYTSDVGAEGIAYNKLLLDASGISQEDLFYLDLYIQMVGSMETPQHSSDELEGLKQEYLNGFWVDSYYPTSKAGDNCRPYVRITWINDPADQEQSLNLLLDLLKNGELNDKEGFLLWLGTSLAQWNPGQRDAFTLADQVTNASYGESRRYSSYLDSAEDYDFLSQLYQRMERDPDALTELQDKLKQIGDTLCQRDHMISMLVTDEESMESTKAATRKVLEALPSRPMTAPHYDLPSFPDKTGIITEESLCFNFGKVYTRDVDGISGAVFPFLSALGDQYLLPELRYTGQTYSVGCTYDNLLEQINVYSAADQGAAASIKIFLGMADALEQMELTQEALDGYIIRAYSMATMPSTETQRAIDAMTSDLKGFDMELTNQWTRQIKATTLEDQQKAVTMLRDLLSQMKLATVGNGAILNEDADYYDAVYDYRRP